MGGPTARPLLADAQFLRLWLVGACTATARWLEMLAVGIFVFEETGSPPLVAAMLMLRMLPLALFGLFGGEIAGRFDRRRTLLATFAALAALAGVLASLAVFGRLAVWHVALGAFIAGYFTWFGARMVWESVIWGERAIGLVAVPLWLPRTAIALGALVLAISFVDELIRVLRGDPPIYGYRDAAEVAAAEEDGDPAQSGETVSSER